MSSSSSGPGGPATTYPGAALLPGQSPPFTVITRSNQSGVLLIAAALGLVFAFISLLIRAYIRLHFRQKVGYDDLTSVLSMALAIVQSGLVFGAVSKGFGIKIGDNNMPDLEEWQKDLYASDILYIVTMWMSKCSIAFMFYRLSPDPRHNTLTTSVLAGTTIVSFISILVVALRCNMQRPWIFMENNCVDAWNRWRVWTAFDVTTEVCLFSIAVAMVQGLRLVFLKKSVVVLAFGLRLPIILAAIIRLHYLASEIFGPDPPLDGVIAQCCTQIEISYAIIATTTPCLRPFMSALNTHYGGPQDARTSTTASNNRKSFDISLTSLSFGSKFSREGKARGKRGDGSGAGNRDNGDNSLQVPGIRFTDSTRNSSSGSKDVAERTENI